MSVHVLVVEDERKLANILALYLESSGYRVTVLHDGHAVTETISHQSFDIVLMDWLLPGVDGITLCQEIRKTSDLPIIMITAKVDESDRVMGLEAGADDYICKPFSLREMVARIRAQLRRRRPGVSVVPRDLVHIDDAAHRVFVNGNEMDLALTEYRLLKVLLSNAGHVLSRDELVDKIYLDNRVVEDRTIDSHIKRLRLKMQSFGLKDAISTVYGVGYRWDPDRVPDDH